MNVQCSQCGESQDFDEGYPICLKCGNRLSESDKLILKNPRKGRGMWGFSILLFIAFASVFVFFSKFFGAWGMVISLLVYLWGRYKVQRNRLDSIKKKDDQR